MPLSLHSASNVTITRVDREAEKIRSGELHENTGEIQRNRFTEGKKKVTGGLTVKIKCGERKREQKKKQRTKEMTDGIFRRVSKLCYHAECTERGRLTGK